MRPPVLVPLVAAHLAFGAPLPVAVQRAVAERRPALRVRLASNPHLDEDLWCDLYATADVALAAALVSRRRLSARQIGFAVADCGEYRAAVLRHLAPQLDAAHRDLLAGRVLSAEARTLVRVAAPPAAFRRPAVPLPVRDVVGRPVAALVTRRPDPPLVAGAGAVLADAFGDDTEAWLAAFDAADTFAGTWAGLTSAVSAGRQGARQPGGRVGTVVG